MKVVRAVWLDLILGLALASGIIDILMLVNWNTEVPLGTMPYWSVGLFLAAIALYLAGRYGVRAIIDRLDDGLWEELWEDDNESKPQQKIPHESAQTKT